MIRVAINGFGRVGRAFFRLSINDPEIQVIAINDCVEIKELAYLLKYDSIHGKFCYEVDIADDNLLVDDRQIKVFRGNSLKAFPWRSLGVDVVVEATGVMRTSSLSRRHLLAGAKKVLITAIPIKKLLGNIPIFLYGVNEKKYRGEKVISAASCSANCAAPVLKVLNDELSVQGGILTAVHAYTRDQSILDAPHYSDLRRGRAAALNIVPSRSEAARVVSELVPGLKGKLMGSTIRVPVADGSLMNIICKVKKAVDVREVNEIIKKSAEAENIRIIEYSTEPLVSRDIVNNTHSAIFDSLLTCVMPPSFIKLTIWFDHEWGYASRLIDIVKHICTN